MLAIVDYGVGNLANLHNALEYQGLNGQIVREPAVLEQAQGILLPGVGAFAPAMECLRTSGLIETLQRCLARQTPLLGVCVGMELFFEESEEDGLHKGLGWIPGRIVRFKTALKTPQIGWNQVRWQQPEDPLCAGIPKDSHFYFVHSYHARLASPDHLLGEADYDGAFPAAVRRGNLWGVQFHPEKSQQLGLRLLANFARIVASRA